MEETFKAYIKSLEMGEGALGRIDGIFKFYKEFCPEKVGSLFINDYIDENGNRNWDSLFLFSGNFIMEAKLFLQQDSFDITPMAKQIRYIEVKSIEYNFKKAKTDSRIFVALTFLDMITARLKGSGKNCDSLKQILLKHFTPNLIKENGR